jgi:hypothetical protein
MGKLLGLLLCHSTFVRNSLDAFQTYRFVAHETCVMVFSWMVDIAGFLACKTKGV